MRAGRASRTAEHNALFRALESAAPEGERLFDDPLARAFLRWPLAAGLRLAVAVPGGRVRLCRYIDGRWRGVRTTVAARTRLIDDTLADVVDGRTEQVVILGAGFDTRAHRLPALRRRGVTVFEVDHPDTQAAKRRSLGKRGERGERPGNVRYVATDFEQQRFESAMADAGYRPGVRSVIVWEGVTNYLTEAAVDATLRWCARAAPGSTLVFTYVHRDVLTDPDRFVGTDQLFATLDSVGERFTFGLDPAEVAGFLGRRGLALQSDVGAVELRRRYLGEAGARIRGHDFYRVVIAQVARQGTMGPDGDDTEL